MCDLKMTENQILIDHWGEIPAFAYIDVPKDKYYSHPVRSEIIGLFREGIEEISSEGKSQVRHALNVTEIKELLKKRKDITMSTTNLYFHLDVLEEIGLITSEKDSSEKRIYSLTEGGKEFLSSLKESLKAFIDIIDEVIETHDEMK